MSSVVRRSRHVAPVSFEALHTAPVQGLGVRELAMIVGRVAGWWVGVHMFFVFLGVGLRREAPEIMYRGKMHT